MSYLSFWHVRQTAVLHLYFTPTTPSCTQESNAAMLTLRSEQQARVLHTDGERKADRTELWVTFTLLEGLTQAADSKRVGFDINLLQLKAFEYLGEKKKSLGYVI